MDNNNNFMFFFNIDLLLRLGDIFFSLQWIYVVENIGTYSRDGEQK